MIDEIFAEGAQIGHTQGRQRFFTDNRSGLRGGWQKEGVSWVITRRSTVTQIAKVHGMLLGRLPLRPAFFIAALNVLIFLMPSRKACRQLAYLS